MSLRRAGAASLLTQQIGFARGLDRVCSRYLQNIANDLVRDHSVELHITVVSWFPTQLMASQSAVSCLYRVDRSVLGVLSLCGAMGNGQMMENEDTAPWYWPMGFPCPCPAMPMLSLMQFGS